MIIEREFLIKSVFIITNEYIFACDAANLYVLVSVLLQLLSCFMKSVIYRCVIYIAKH